MKFPSPSPLALLLPALLAGSAVAQHSPDADLRPLTSSPADALGAGDPVPGDRPGTERWILHLRDRPFSLQPFGDAVRGGATPGQVAAVIADLQARAIRHQAPVVAAVIALGGDVVQQWWIVDGMAVDVTPAALAEVRRLPLVERVERDVVCVPVLRAETGVNNHASDLVQRDFGIDGSGVSVAVVDTGHDQDVGGQGRPHRVYFPGGDPNNTGAAGIGGSRLLINRRIGRSPADDVHGHGTGVASIAAGANWGTPGADDGHAPGAGIAGYAIANRSNGNSSSSVMTTAWQTVAADRVQYNIVAANLSYSGSPSPTDAQQIAMDNCALLADVMTVVAAGNSSDSTSSSQGAANGLAVAAILPNTHVVAGFSSRGPLSGQTDRFYPDIAGCGVTTRMAQRDDESVDWEASGTSMAAPQCAGAATLIRAANPSLSALETKAILLATTDDISGANRTAPSNTRNAYGLGMLRDDRAVGLALGTDRGRARTATSWSTTVRVEAGRAFSAVATWHRDPSLGASWSDLSLTVLDAAGQSVAGSDTPRNLYEAVRFVSQESADYTLRVDVQGLQSGLVDQEFGWAFSEVRLPPVEGRLESFGSGCPASGAPRLTFSGTAQTRSVYSLLVRDAQPDSLITLIAGFSRETYLGIVPLPLDLTPFGAPGCELLVSTDVLGTLTVRSDGTSFQLVSVPNDSSLVGFELFYQLAYDDPRNALGLSTSNAVAMRVGGQP